jgi:Fe-S cluster assembly protein SufD
MNLKFEEFHKSNLKLKELDNIRIKNFKKFETKGFPTKKQEHWKYTDLKTLINRDFEDLKIFNENRASKSYNNFLIKNFEHNKIVLLNGNFIESNFELEDEKNISVKSLKDSLGIEKDFDKIKSFFDDDQNSLISLNNALTNDGIIFEIADNYSFKKPLIIYNFFDKSSHNKIINNKVFITLGSGSQLSLVDYYKSEDDIKYFNNSIHNYSIKKNAILKKFNINNILNKSYNYNSTKVKSYNNSVFENFLLSIGSSLIKNEVHCDLLESFSSCFINGIMFLKGDQHHELKTNVNHLYEDCKSSQLIKSVLLNNSQGTYQGKIYVDKNAQKTNGYQLSKALILSKNSEFNSKPELEIYADDVKCSHGSTSGNIDENSIFYLMSRGLTKEQATKMIVKGFLNEVIETITDPNIKKLISELFIDSMNKTEL